MAINIINFSDENLINKFKLTLFGIKTEKDSIETTESVKGDYIDNGGLGLIFSMGG